MALFNSHTKCARCREKGVGDDPCVKKLECQSTAAGHPNLQVLERTWKKSMTESDATPILVDPTEVTLLDGYMQTSHRLLNQHLL